MVPYSRKLSSSFSCLNPKFQHLTFQQSPETKLVSAAIKQPYQRVNLLGLMLPKMDLVHLE
jgi:hypothetical protein